MITLQNMAPLMVAGLVIAMLIGFPVSFSLAALGLFAGFASIELGFFPAQYLADLPSRLFGILSNDLLLAIPFFTFMGAILERSGLAEDLLDGAGQMFGSLPGGLAYAVIISGAILGAMTGTVAASVIAMGAVTLPIMMRYGYNIRLASGVIAASGTITQLVPPSLVLVVLADQLGKPAADLYKGAIGPSIAQALIFIAYVVVLSIVRPKDMPALPPEARTLRGWPLWRKVLWGIVPSVVLIFLVLGTVFMRMATPTEAGAMGAVGAMGLAAINRRLNWPLVRQAMESTMRITAMVLFVLIGSTVFLLVFRGVGGDQWIEQMLTHLTGGNPTAFLVGMSIVVFLLAFLLDFFEIAFIVVPLLAPVAAKLGIDLVWFGVLLCVSMQTSFMPPPFGVALSSLRGIAPKEVKRSDINLGAIPWLLLQLILVAILICWPGMVTDWLDQEKVRAPDQRSIEVPGDSSSPKPRQSPGIETNQPNGGGPKADPGGADKSDPQDDPAKAPARQQREDTERGAGDNAPSPATDQPKPADSPTGQPQSSGESKPDSEPKPGELKPGEPSGPAADPNFSLGSEPSSPQNDATIESPRAPDDPAPAQPSSPAAPAEPTHAVEPAVSGARN